MHVHFLRFLKNVRFWHKVLRELTCDHIFYFIKIVGAPWTCFEFELQIGKQLYRIIINCIREYGGV